MVETHREYQESSIAELTNGIILAHYERQPIVRESYQTEQQLENHLIEDLQAQGYEYLPINDPKGLEANLKVQIERLNHVTFNASEWQRFGLEYLDSPSDGFVEKTRKVQENEIYDFTFDDGHTENIKIIDKKQLANNHLQVVHQVTQQGVHLNRYDVTILINGLPLVQIELKKRGVALSEAFNQIHRYSKESFNEEHSLFKYVQIFVISNGTYTRYFANTKDPSKNNYEFTCEWADAKNNTIHSLEDFTATFLAKRTLLEVLTKYCVFDADDTLLIMRPYQIAATERILWKIDIGYKNNLAGSVDAGGFIWHTTGSGKTLTSFKAARLATQLPYIDKVFFVVDRKDLDYQTMKEYQKFQPNSVNGSRDTKALTKAIEKKDDKIVVTTIQKLNEFVKRHSKHEIYDKHCVLIYDECHRSQFGTAQKNIRKHFKKYYQFGFTGTPIFPENSPGIATTADVFGRQLHSYVITDAIRDQKVLKFKVDYNNISPKFKDAEQTQDEKQLQQLEKQMFLHPERISEVTKHILKVFDKKTHRNENYELKKRRLNGFNAMFAVQNIDAAKMYYEEFEKQQAELPEDKRLKVATIFSYAPNEEQHAIGDIQDENFEPSAMTSTGREFLDKAIADYNQMFGMSFSTEGAEFQNYYKDLAKRVKEREIDLLIVVGMFLTGFDAPTLNTLFVDKNLRYHGLIQAYSRTNRILNSVKPFGNIVCFRDLEQVTKDAIKLFGDENSVNVILERGYKDYTEGYTDEETGEQVTGYKELCAELLTKFPDPTTIERDSDKREFAKLYGEVLKRENTLKNFDEFTDEEHLISDFQMQDFKSTYLKIRDEILKSNKHDDSSNNSPAIDFSDVEFQIDLLKTDEINLDYILAQILEKSKENDDEAAVRKDIKRTIRSSLEVRPKEDLIIGFMDQMDLKVLKTTEDIIDLFYTYAKKKKAERVDNVVSDQKLRNHADKFINRCIEKGEVLSAGEELGKILPKISRRKGAREKKRREIIVLLQDVVDEFEGI